MRRIVSLAIAAVVLSATVASAQTTATANMSINIPSMIKITSDGADFAFPLVTATDIENSQTINSTAGPQLTTKANVGYTVTASAPNFTMSNPVSAADAGAYAKSAGDASVTTGATTKALNAGTALYTRARGSSVDDISGSIHILLTDPAADYTTLVTFTIAAS